MSERLTQRSTELGPRWVSWIPYLLTVLCALVLSAQAPASWSIPDAADSLYANLCRSSISLLSPQKAVFAHVLLSLALFWGGGLLVRSLLPPKTSRAGKSLAQSLGISTLLIALTPWFRDLLSPTPLLPAITALIWAQITLLQSLLPGKHPRAALAGLFAGLLAGLATGLSLFIGLGTIPLGIWLLTDLIRKNNPALRRALFFLAGALLALLPFARELPTRILNSPFSLQDGLQSLAPLYSLFGIGGLLLIFLALLVGILQKNRILITFMLTTTLLFKAGHMALETPTLAYTGTMLFFPALLCAYGIFRILKGIESGVHAVNPAKTKYVTLSLLLLLLLATKLWTAWMFQQI